MTNLFLSVPLSEKILLAKNLALSLKSGVSLVKSLQFLREQTRSRSLRRILDSAIGDTNRGMFLSASFDRYRNVFGDLFINIIRIGETSGHLPENLLYLGDELKKRYDLRRKVRGASVYPAVILVATIGVATGMIVFVFPKFLPLITSLKVELPATTRMLIWISHFLTERGLLAVGLLAGLIVGFIALLRVPAARYLWHRALLMTPILRRIMVHFNMANFARTLSVLLKSGVSITDAITITARTMTNLAYARELEGAAVEIQKGMFLSRTLALHRREFPLLAVNMIEVGENTGNLVENLSYLAEYYENEVDDVVKNLSSILEPILLIVMGGIVGFIALSFITPLYQITRSIK